jgi:hypothetical protein
MTRLAALASLLLVPSVAPAATVTPPSQPGPWRQIGAAVTSRAGKQVNVTRTALDPHALAFVATSSSSRRIRVTWWTYCEFDSDDGPTEEHQGTLTGVKRVVSYPSVMKDSTLCYLAVTARVPGTPKARATAAVFAY